MELSWNQRPKRQGRATVKRIEKMNIVFLYELTSSFCVLFEPRRTEPKPGREPSRAGPNQSPSLSPNQAAQGRLTRGESNQNQPKRAEPEPEVEPQPEPNRADPSRNRDGVLSSRPEPRPDKPSRDELGQSRWTMHYRWSP